MERKKHNNCDEVINETFEDLYEDGKLVGHVRKFTLKSSRRTVNVRMEFNIPSQECIRRWAEKIIEINYKNARNNK